MFGAIPYRVQLACQTCNPHEINDLQRAKTGVQNIHYMWGCMHIQGHIMEGRVKKPYVKNMAGANERQNPKACFYNDLAVRGKAVVNVNAKMLRGTLIRK